MRININSLSQIKNIGFGNGDKKAEKTSAPLTECNSIKNITPDFNVKTPQKYTKLEVVELPEQLKAHVYKLESGQRVVVVPKEGPTVVKTYVNTGALNEKDDERGISHFVEHSLFNGSDGLNEGEFFETVNKMGANTNASTGFSATDYYIKSNLLDKEDLEKQIKIHASMLETPKFTPEMIVKEKGPVTSEISMILDDTENIAVNSSIKKLFNIQSTSQDIIGGTINNINNLTREKVLNYYKQNYYPANMVTVVTGDVKEDETIKLVSKYMQSKTQAPVARRYETLSPIEKSVREDITSDKAPAAFISMAFTGPKNNDTKSQVVFDAVSYVLTDSVLSRINKSLEDVQAEAGLMIERVSSKPGDNTAILLVSELDNKKVDAALEKINASIVGLKTNPPTAEEIEVIKKNLLIDFENRFETSSDVNSIIGGVMLNGDLSMITEYKKIVDSLTPQDFVDFAEKYLDVNKQSTCIVHPTSKNNLSFGSSKIVNTDSVKETTLDNNVLVIENNTNKELSFADFRMSLDDNIKEEKVGASVILSYILSRGSANLSKDEFYGQAEKDGIRVGFSSDSNSISVSTSFIKNDAQKAIQNVKDVILNPRFEDFEEMKKQAIQDVKDTPISSRDKLYGELFKGHQKGITRDEMLEGLKTVTVDDVKTLHEKIVNNSQMRVAISGPFNDEGFKNTVEKELNTSSFKAPKVSYIESFEPTEKVKVITNPHNKSQAEIAVGYKFKINDDSVEKMTRYSLLNIILGGTASSRLFNDLRESQKLAYHVASYLDYNDDDTGVCTLYIKTTADNEKTFKNIEKAIKGFNKNIQKLLNEKVTEEELHNAKLVLKNRLYNDNETTRTKNATILSNSQTKVGVNLANEVLECIDSITVEDLYQASAEIFENKPVYSIVAKDKALEANTKFLQNLK